MPPDPRSTLGGFVAIQTMLLRRPEPDELTRFADILKSISPDEVQLNLPTRPVPHDYFLATRGNSVEFESGFTQIKTIPRNELENLRAKLSELTKLQIITK